MKPGTGILQAGWRRGATLIELLTALTIALIFIGSVAAAFIQVIRSSDEAEAVVRAHSSARAAVDQIARELRQLRVDADPGYVQLLLVNRPLAYGNFIDDDGDGAVDEDVIDGIDNDGDWTAGSDQHATIGGLTERDAYVGVADLGDRQVDEDHRFSADEATFIQPPGTLGPGSFRRRVTYRLGTFDTEQNVLLRAYIDNPTTTGTGTEVVEPVVFDVVSLDILAWNANNNVAGPVAGEPYWQSEWDATTMNFPFTRPVNAPFGVPPFKFPAAFHISVTVNAERLPLRDISGWPGNARPLRTVTMSTVVNVESVIQDTRYFLFVR